MCSQFNCPVLHNRHVTGAFQIILVVVVTFCCQQFNTMYLNLSLELLVLIGEKIWWQKSSKFMVMLLIKPPDNVCFCIFVVKNSQLRYCLLVVLQSREKGSGDHWKHLVVRHSCLLPKKNFVTARKLSCGKVRFLHLSVSHSVHRGRGFPNREPPPRQRSPWTETLPGQRPPKIETPCTLKSGRYASNWNAFLFSGKIYFW